MNMLPRRSNDRSTLTIRRHGDLLEHFEYIACAPSYQFVYICHIHDDHRVVSIKCLIDLSNHVMPCTLTALNLQLAVVGIGGHQWQRPLLVCRSRGRHRLAHQTMSFSLDGRRAC